MSVQPSRKTMIKLGIALLAMVPAAASAQTAPAAPAATPVDPAKLAASRALMEQVMPAATREQLMTSMMRGMSQNMLQAIRQNADLEATLSQRPGAKAVFDKFMQRQMDLGTEQLKAALPGMLEAMAHAYARRFTLAQLKDLSTFFSTPTGQVYLAQAPTIMSDPDVGAWMGAFMGNSMKRMPAEMEKLTAELKALDAKGAGHGG